MNSHSIPKRLLVSGDFSGIQDTVYTISSKGALKMLRARSFMLELLNEHIVYELFKLSHETQREGLQARSAVPAEVVFSGGGGFCLILPSREALQQQISAFTESINEWAIKELSSKLFVAVDHMEVSTHDLEHDFATLRKKQVDNLERTKRLRFLTPDGRLLRGLLAPTMPLQLSNEKTCQLSGRDDLADDQMDTLPNGDVVCRLSLNLWHLGQQLSKVSAGSHIYRHRFDGTILNGALLFPSPTAGKNGLAMYSILEVKGDYEKRWTVGQDFFYAYYNRQIKDLPEEQRKTEVKAISIEQPKTSKEDILEYTASLAGLASCAVGVDMIGALRMDVDDLGLLFSTISDYRELANRSRQINLFFKSILNDICRCRIHELMVDHQKTAPLLTPTQLDQLRLPTRLDTGMGRSARNVSVVYAGGDDLFIVGAWDDVLELSFDIQQCFHAYCKACGIQNPQNNMYGSISAGLTIHPAKFPLYQMARRSGEAEAKAKAGIDFSDTHGQKNRFAFFHDSNKEHRRQKLLITQNEDRYALSMRWEVTREFLLPLMRDLSKLGSFQLPHNGRRIFELDHISRRSIEKWFRVIERFNKVGELYLPAMARVMADLRNQLVTHQGETQGLKVFLELMKFLYKLDNSNMAYVHLALNWLSYLGRIT